MMEIEAVETGLVTSEVWSPVLVQNPVLSAGLTQMTSSASNRDGLKLLLKW